MTKSNEKKEWIAYVGPFPFPYGQAGSRRVFGMANSLAGAGYDVVVGSGDPSPTSHTKLDGAELNGSVYYVGLNETPEKSASIIEKSSQVFWYWGKKTVKWLDSLEHKPAYVFVYGGSAQYIMRLLPWCRKNKIPLIVDVVEWYDPRQMKGGILGPFNLSAKLALRYLYPRCDGIIAISQFLANHYKTKGCPVVRIPPTTDVFGIIDETKFYRDRKDNNKIRLIYAGTPGKKDLLGNVIKAVTSLDPLGERLELLVLGPTLTQVAEIHGTNELPPCVNVAGHVSQSEVAEYIKSADFSVLLREPLLFANAGFPTKFVESMANGTPVIANITSDLGLYLSDGVEGFVCTDHSPEALVLTLNRALSLSQEDMRLMRDAARRQAINSFDFRAHSSKLIDFLKITRQ